jgi:hypothetical protein
MLKRNKYYLLFIMETRTSFARSTGTNSNREDDNNDEYSLEGDNKHRPQFRDDCFRKMELMIELLVFKLK